MMRDLSQADMPAWLPSEHFGIAVLHCPSACLEAAVEAHRKSTMCERPWHDPGLPHVHAAAALHAAAEAGDSPPCRARAAGSAGTPPGARASHARGCAALPPAVCSHLRLCVQESVQPGSRTGALVSCFICSTAWHHEICVRGWESMPCSCSAVSWELCSFSSAGLSSCGATSAALPMYGWLCLLGSTMSCC